MLHRDHRDPVVVRAETGLAGMRRLYWKEMNRLIASALLVGGLGCAGSVTPVVLAPTEASVEELVLPGVKAPVTEPVQAEPLPLWLRPILLVRGDVERGAYRLPPGFERSTLRAVESLRCATEWLEEDPRPPKPLWIDLVIGPAGNVADVSPRGARQLAWPCLSRALANISYDPPEGGRLQLSLALFFRPSSLSWGRSPALRPMFPPRERGDAPREPHEIAYDQDETDFLWSLGRLRTRSSIKERPSTELERLLSWHRASEIHVPPEQEATAAAERLSTQDADPAVRTTARLLLARMHQLRGDKLASYRALLSLVCPNVSSGIDPQERSEIYWSRWYGLHPSRESLHPTPKALRDWAKSRERLPSESRRKPPKDMPSSLDEETSSRDPFERCAPAGGASREMLAEAWAIIGNFHTIDGSLFGGPFSPNRAASAYNRSLALVEDSVVRLQLALIHQQAWRYRASAEELSRLLQREPASGEGALIRNFALPALAFSMIEPDFEGQPPNEPPLQGNDLQVILLTHFDNDFLIIKRGSKQTQSRPKLPPFGEIALEHLRDPSLVPAGSWFAHPLLMAAGRALYDLGQLKDAARLYEHAQANFPMHRDAPATTAALIRLYQRQGQISYANSPEQLEAARQQAAAQKRFETDFLATGSPWAQSHQHDHEALKRLGDLARQLAEKPP